MLASANLPAAVTSGSASDQSSSSSSSEVDNSSNSKRGSLLDLVTAGLSTDLNVSAQSKSFMSFFAVGVWLVWHSLKVLRVCSQHALICMPMQVAAHTTHACATLTQSAHLSHPMNVSCRPLSQWTLALP